MSEKEHLHANTAKRTGGYHIVSKEKCNIWMSTRKTEKCKDKEKKVYSATN
jgi:hypothetical protein